MMAPFPTRTTAAVLALMLGLVACGGGSEPQRIASTACGLYEDLLDGDLDALFDEQMLEQFEELEVRAAEAEMTDADIQAAVEAECPSVIADLEDAFGGGY